MFKYPKKFELYYMFDGMLSYRDELIIDNEIEEIQLFFELKKQNQIISKTTKGQFKLVNLKKKK